MPSSLSPYLWMGDLDEDIDEESVMNIFAQFGEVVRDVKLRKKRDDPNAKKPSNFIGPIKSSKYYCFVEFKDVETAQRVIQKLNGKYMPGVSGKRFKLNPASYGRTKRELYPEFSLYVRDLSLEVDDCEMFAFFIKRFKSTRNAKVVMDKQTGKSKGFGFVRFSDENDQQTALIEMQHMTGLGRRPITVSLAQAKRPNVDKYHEKPEEKHDGAPIPGFVPAASAPATSYYAGSYTWGGVSVHYNQSLSEESQAKAHERYDEMLKQGYRDQRDEKYKDKHFVMEEEESQEVDQQYQHQQQYYNQHAHYDQHEQQKQQPQPQASEQPQSRLTHPQMDPDEMLEDPYLEINIGRENRDYIDSSESFFAAIEDSRWLPLDNIMSEIPELPD